MTEELKQEAILSVQKKYDKLIQDEIRQHNETIFNIQDEYAIKQKELMNALNDAYLHDMLIVDEPESSFDNVFLNKNVNAILKEISKTMPVFVVTHNNSIGASIKPDYLLYTNFEIDSEGELKYRVFTGKPTSKYLKSADNTKIENYVIQMQSLEGGHSEYNKRRVMYEGIDKT